MLTTEQKLKRMQGLGASDSAIHMGYSKFMTPYELYLQKTGLIEQDFEESELQYWGNKLEKVIAERFEEDNNVKVTFPDTIYHDEHKFIFANLDGFIESENAVLEIKNVNSFMRKEWDFALEDGIPMPYLIQVAKQCLITNADKGYIAVLIGGMEYMQFEYKRDPELEQLILNADIKFWHCVENRIEPEPVTLADCKMKYKEAIADKSVQCTFRVESMLCQLQNIKSNIKQLTKKENDYKMKICDFIKDAEYLVSQDGEILATWKANKKGTRILNIKG